MTGGGGGGVRRGGGRAKSGRKEREEVGKKIARGREKGARREREREIKERRTYRGVKTPVTENVMKPSSGHLNAIIIILLLFISSL